MSKPPVNGTETAETGKVPGETPRRKSSRAALIISVVGIVLTLAMFAAIIIFDDQVKQMQQWGYLGAFFISIIGGATIIIPVPMLAVVVALASALGTPWEVALLGFSAAAGELIGAMIIYYTGHGAGRAISRNKMGGIQKTYDKVLGFIERRGAWALFAVTFIINPFFYPAAFASGALNFRLRKFILVVTFGKLIKSMTVVYAAYYGLKGIFRAIGIDI